MLYPLPGDRPAIIRLAESGGLGVVFAAEPAVGAGQRRIAAADLQVIDADIAGDARAQGVLALDAAARRHRGLVGEDHLAYFAILVGATCTAKESTVLLSTAKLLWRDKAALPKPAAVVSCVGLVVLESASRGGFETDRKPLPDEKLVQTGGFTFDHATADMPLLVGGIGAQILATHLAAANQADQLVARVNPASPGVGVVVDANLVQRRRIDAVEPIGHVRKLDGAAVPDEGARGE